MSIYKPKGRPYYQYDFVVNGVRHHGSTGQKDRDTAQWFEDEKRRALVDAPLNQEPRPLAIDPDYDTARDGTTLRRGLLAEAVVAAELTRHGYHVALPISGHLPYDMIAENRTGRMRRIQVKYISARNNRLAVPIVNVHTNGQGVVTKEVNRTAVDGFAVYCPQTQAVYYIPIAMFDGVTTQLTLRLGKRGEVPAKRYRYRNGRSERVPAGSWHRSRAADDFLDPSLLFRGQSTRRPGIVPADVK